MSGNPKTAGVPETIGPPTPGVLTVGQLVRDPVGALTPASAVYPAGRVNWGVMLPATFSVRAGVVPNGLVPLQSNRTNPEVPVVTEDTLGVSAAQFEVRTAVVAEIAGNVCVKSVVAA